MSKRNPVATIGVDRLAVGRDNGATGAFRSREGRSSARLLRWMPAGRSPADFVTFAVTTPGNVLL
jgi:hypothetical protein